MRTNDNIRICNLIVKQILSFATDADIDLLKLTNISYVIDKDTKGVYLYNTNGLHIFISKCTGTNIGKYIVITNRNSSITKQVVLYDELCKIIIGMLRETP